MSAVDVATVTLNGNKTLLTHVVSTSFIKGIAVFSNGTRSPAKNSPDCAILDS